MYGPVTLMYVDNYIPRFKRNEKGGKTLSKYLIGGGNYKPNYAERHMTVDNLPSDSDVGSDSSASSGGDESDDSSD